MARLSVIERTSSATCCALASSSCSGSWTGGADVCRVRRPNKYPIRAIAASAAVSMSNPCPSIPVANMCDAPRPDGIGQLVEKLVVGARTEAAHAHKSRRRRDAQKQEPFLVIQTGHPRPPIVEAGAEPSANRVG